MSAEVLVVDDNISAAKDFARLIRIKTKLETLAVDNPDLAIEKIKAEPIKVVVLDQKMPEKTGTALFEDIKRINPNIKAIMLSGEAEPQEGQNKGGRG